MPPKRVASHSLAALLDRARGPVEGGFVSWTWSGFKQGSGIGAIRNTAPARRPRKTKCAVVPGPQRASSCFVTPLAAGGVAEQVDGLVFPDGAGPRRRPGKGVKVVGHRVAGEEDERACAPVHVEVEDLHAALVPFHVGVAGLEFEGEDGFHGVRGGESRSENPPGQGTGPTGLG